MKMIIAIIRTEIKERVQDMLADKEIGMTKLSSTGGFLNKGSTTFLIGAEDDEVDDIIATIKRCCGNNADDEEHDAIVFVTNMNQMLRY